MEDLIRLVAAKKKIEAEIKSVKKAQGNWFKRFWQAQEMRVYYRLQRKFEGVDRSAEIESLLDQQLNRMEALLDKAIGDEQCLQADSR